MQVNAFKGIALAAINLLNMGQSIEDVRKANGLAPEQIEKLLIT